MIAKKYKLFSCFIFLYLRNYYLNIKILSQFNKIGFHVMDKQKVNYKQAKHLGII